MLLVAATSFVVAMRPPIPPVKLPEKSPISSDESPISGSDESPISEQRECFGDRCQSDGCKKMHPERYFSKREWRNFNQTRLCANCKKLKTKGWHPSPTDGEWARAPFEKDMSRAQHTAEPSLSDVWAVQSKRQKDEREAERQLQEETNAIFEKTRDEQNKRKSKTPSSRSRSQSQKADIESVLGQYKTLLQNTLLQNKSLIHRLAIEVQQYWPQNWGLSGARVRERCVLTAFHHKVSDILKSVVNTGMKNRRKKLAGLCAVICKARLLTSLLYSDPNDDQLRGHCLQICAAYRCWKACLSSVPDPEREQMLRNFVDGFTDAVVGNRPDLDLREMASRRWHVEKSNLDVKKWSLTSEHDMIARFLSEKSV